MTRRFVTTIAFAAGGPFALAIATPAQACDGHKQTADTHKKADKAATKASGKTDQAPAVQDKKADASAPASTLLAAGCNCTKDAKDCKCKGECGCHKEKQEKPKASAATAGGALLAGGCNCDKDGKNCTCPKGECKCPNCHKDKPKAHAA